MCQQGFSSHDGSPMDTIPGSRPNGVPSSALINLIPINLQDCSALPPWSLLWGALNRPGPRTNVTGMNQLLVYVIGANGFSSMANKRRNASLSLAVLEQLRTRGPELRMFLWNIQSWGGWGASWQHNAISQILDLLTLYISWNKILYSKNCSHSQIIIW